MNDSLALRSEMPERDKLLLEFVHLYRREKAYHDAVVLVLQMLAHSGNSQSMIGLVDLIRENQAPCLRLRDELFQPLENAISEGSDYQPLLRSVVDRLK